MNSNIDIYRAEYLHLQSTIEGFDNKALTIKAWSITFSLTACGVAFASHAKVTFLIASIASLIFWLLEASWKTFQYAHYERITEIEDYIDNKIHTLVPLQITRSWHTSFRKGGIKRLFKIMFWYHVYLPHLLISMIAFLLFVLTYLKYISI
jgi:hypothetical protein